MNFFKYLLNPTSWFGWTAAGQGARHALHDYPKATDFEAIGSGAETLWDLRALLLARVHAIGKSATSGIASKDDFDSVCGYLRTLLVARDPSWGKGSTTEGNLKDLALEIVDLLNEQNGSGTGSRTLPKLTYWEAARLKMAEEEIDHLVAKWEAQHHLFENQAKAEHNTVIELKEKAHKLHLRHRELGLREPHQHIPTGLYLVMLIGLALFELPVNLAAFHILNEDDFSRIALSVGTSACIVTMSHCSGMILRHFFQGESRIMDTIVFLVGVFAALIGVTGVAVLRATWIGHEATVAGLLEDAQIPTLTLEQITHVGAALAGINALFFLAGVMLSYLAHDANRELERLYRQKLKVREQLRKQWLRYGQAAVKFDKLRGVTLSQISTIRHRTFALFSEYRTYNTLHRTGPPTFQESSDKSRFFEPRNLGSEIDLPPVAVDTFLANVEGVLP